MTAKVLVVNSPKYDLLTALIIEGLLKREDLTLGFTSLGNYAPADKVLRGQRLRRFRDDVDVIVLGITALYLMMKYSGITGAATRVVLEGGDDSLLNISPLRLPKIDWLLKRELYQTSDSVIFI